MCCDPRFDYARATHVDRRSDTEILFVGRSGSGELALRLRSSVPMKVADGAAQSRSSAPRRRVGVVRPRSRHRRTVTEPEPRLRGRRVQGDRQLLAALDRPEHVYQPLARMVNRSALAEAPHLQGARLGPRGPDLRAARTNRRSAKLGLPLRVDSRLVVLALRDDAPWLHGRGRGVHALDDGALRRAGAGRLATDYVRVDGRRVTDEETLPHPEGYMGSRPVRIGNAPTRTFNSTSTAS